MGWLFCELIEWININLLYESELEKLTNNLRILFVFLCVSLGITQVKCWIHIREVLTIGFGVVIISNDPFRGKVSRID